MARLVRAILFVGLAALALQGCAEMPWKQWLAIEDEPAPPQEEKAEVYLPDPAPTEAPVTPVAKPEVPQETLAALPPEEDLPPAPPVADLVGLDFAAVRDLLGDPALEEIKAPATVWAYNGSGCVLNVFFYPHVDGGSFKALTYEVRGPEEGEGVSQRCFAELLKDRSKTEAN